MSAGFRHSPDYERLLDELQDCFVMAAVERLMTEQLAPVSKPETHPCPAALEPGLFTPAEQEAAT